MKSIYKVNLLFKFYLKFVFILRKNLIYKIYNIIFLKMRNVDL